MNIIWQAVSLAAIHFSFNQAPQIFKEINHIKDAHQLFKKQTQRNNRSYSATGKANEPSKLQTIN